MHTSHHHKTTKKPFLGPLLPTSAFKNSSFPDVESTDQEKTTASKSTVHMAQTLFPSMLCTSFVEVIKLLDDHAVSLDGTAVYEVAYQIIWSCLVEDSNLFLKYFMEQLTREKSVETFQIIRKMIRFIPKLPQQAAFSLYNYIIGNSLKRFLADF